MLFISFHLQLKERGKGSPPDFPVCEMLEGGSESKALLLEIMPIDGDSVIDELTFFLVKEGGLLGEIGHEDESQNSRNEGEDSHQDLFSSALNEAKTQGHTKIQDHPASPPAGATWLYC